MDVQNFCCRVVLDVGARIFVYRENRQFDEGGAGVGKRKVGAKTTTSYLNTLIHRVAGFSLLKYCSIL